MPARGSPGRDTATGDEAVDVGVIMELLGPGVQNRKDTDGTPHEAVIAGNVDDGLGGGLHQQRIAVTLVGAQDLTQLLGYGDGDVKVGAGQHLELAGLEPALGVGGVALGAAAVLALMWPAT
jgi:hypothetical protein